MADSESQPTSSPPLPRFDSLEQEVYLNLWRTYDRLKVMEEKMFGEFGLSPQQYNTLRLLRAAFPESVPTLTLGSRLISRAPDMTRLLDRLEQRDLLTRERRADNRRVVEVRITQQGLDLLDEMDPSVQNCHAQQLGHLDEETLSELARLLREARQPHEEADRLSFVDQE